LHAHVGVAVPHLRHIEYFHDHHRIETMLFDGALDPRGGFSLPLSMPSATACRSRRRTPPPTKLNADEPYEIGRLARRELGNDNRN
jgi:hypothetical protein